MDKKCKMVLKRIQIVLLLILMSFKNNSFFAQNESESTYCQIKKELKDFLKTSVKGDWVQRVKKTKLEKIPIEFDLENLSAKNVVVFLIREKSTKSKLFIFFDEEKGCLIDCLIDSPIYLNTLNLEVIRSKYFILCVDI